MSQSLVTRMDYRLVNPWGSLQFHSLLKDLILMAEALQKRHCEPLALPELDDFDTSSR